MSIFLRAWTGRILVGISRSLLGYGSRTTKLREICLSSLLRKLISEVSIIIKAVHVCVESHVYTLDSA